jgi:type IV pilus assembly protein PilM
MAENRSAWGIDIGQSALKAIKLSYQDDTGKAVAEAFDYVPYPKILSQPDAIPDELIAQAMQTFLSRNDVTGDLIAISVPGQSALARFIQLPPVETSKLAEIIKYEARQQIPFALDEVIWDYQPLGSGAEESGYLLDAEVGLFAMKRDQVQQALKPFNDAKLEVELIQIAPLTLYNVLTFDELGVRPDQDSEAQDEYIIMLDMGCDNTALLVSNGKKIWVRNVPLGGNHFTRALTKEMKLSFAKAEHLKCNATKAPDPRAVFQALRPVFNDYASEIQRSIGFFSSVNRSAKISKVIGLGNGFKLAGLQKFLQQNLQYEVERPDTFKAVTGDAVLNSPLFSDNMLSFGVAYGLALQALGQTRIRTSLLPPEITTARMIRRKKPWAVAACAALMLGYAISTMGNANSYAKPHAQVFSEVEEKAKEIKTRVDGFKTTYDGEVAKFTGTKGEVNKLIDGRRDLTWLELYNAVLDCLPRDQGDEQDTNTDIEKRQLISLTSFTSEKKADVGEWFNTLLKPQKAWMLPGEKGAAPSGEGYIITLVGQHWHHTEGDAQDNDVRYLQKTLLHNLQQPSMVVPDVEKPRDVRRMGISHPTIIWSNATKTLYDPLGVTKKGPANEYENSRFAGNSRFGVGSGGFGGAALSGRGTRADEGDEVFGPRGVAGGFLPGRGGAVGNPAYDPRTPLPEGARWIDQTDFTIQFVYKPIPEAERDAKAQADTGATAPAEGSDPAADTATTSSAIAPSTATPAPSEAGANR